MAAFVDSPEYRYFVDQVKRLSNIDLGNYKPWQIQRRLSFIMDQAGIKDYKQYADLLASDKERLAKFIDWVTINVSEFYRDPLKFKELQQIVLPKLLQHNRQLKIWSAGCSNGSEAYTLALILEEMTPGVKHTIIGTDIDERILNSARDGEYLERDVKNIPPHLFKRFFVKSDDKISISDKIKNRVTFKKNDLLKDEYDKDFDLILCRNVVIYFTNEAKDNIYKKFLLSLKDHGVLFVGGAESILNAHLLGFRMTHPFFYSKDSNAGNVKIKKAS
jgi:chemotaxis protein methyltransferase CheR